MLTCIGYYYRYCCYVICRHPFGHMTSRKAWVEVLLFIFKGDQCFGLRFKAGYRPSWWGGWDRATLLRCWICKRVQHEDEASLDNWYCRSSEKWAGIWHSKFSACLEVYRWVGDLERVSRRSETWRAEHGEPVQERGIEWVEWTHLAWMTMIWNP